MHCLSVLRFKIETMMWMEMALGGHLGIWGERSLVVCNDLGVGEHRDVVTCYLHLNDVTPEARTERSTVLIEE